MSPPQGLRATTASGGAAAVTVGPTVSPAFSGLRGPIIASWKIARTIADLVRAAEIAPAHVSAAVQYRRVPR